MHEVLANIYAAENALGEQRTEGGEMHQQAIRLVQESSMKIGRRTCTHKPACVSREDFGHWMHVARMTGKPKAGFCTDCTPEFKAAQMKKDYCSHPEVEFRVDDEGFVEGFFPLGLVPE